MNDKLKRLHLYPTLRCPLDCIYCYVDEVNKQVEELPVSVYQGLIRQAGELGLECVDIAGGEPFVYKDIIKLVKCITQEGITVKLVSNGLFLNQFQEAIQDMNRIELHISLDSPDESVQDKLRSYAGLFQKVKRNIISMQERFGSCITVNIVINRCNYLSIERMLSYLVSIGIKKVDFQPVMLSGKKAFQNAYGLHTEELLSAYQAIHDFCFSHPSVLQIEAAVPAYFYPSFQKRRLFVGTHDVNCIYVYGRLSGNPYVSSLYIKSNGDAFLSALMINHEKWKIGNIRNEALVQLWRESADTVRQKIKNLKETYVVHVLCGNCIAKKYCFMSDIVYFLPYIEEHGCSIRDEINQL